MHHGPPDIANRMTPVASLAKNCNDGTHEGSFVDATRWVDAKKCIVTVGAATGSPDSFSIVLTLLENTTQDSSGDTAMTGIDAPSGVTADSKTITAAGVYVLHVENTKQYVAGKAVATFTGGSSPAVPITMVFLGEEERF